MGSTLRRPGRILGGMRTVSWVVVLGILALGCGSVQNAAAQDPQRCERDPKCGHHLDKSRDCVTACSDDPACIDRCRQVQDQW
jgi:hypothetical protein